VTRIGILVLGMHRSGTSALTWLLGQLGATLPADAIAATGDNARGYWESQALVRADDQLLRVARSSWFDPRPLDLSRLPADGLRSRKMRIAEAVRSAWGDAPMLAVKDPRQCRFVPLVAEVLEREGIQPRAVLMLRSPAEIAHSLAARDGTTPAYAHPLWLRHMIDAERATRAMPRTVIAYEGLLSDWRSAVERLARLIGAEPAAADAARIEAFLDPALRHHRVIEPAALDAPLAEIVARTEAGLLALIDADGEAERAAIDRAYALLDAVPWVEGDIIHDELRHRRVAQPEEPQEDAEAPPEPEIRVAVPHPGPDPSGDAALIRSSGLFDAAWYLEHYPDAAESGLDPVDHYVKEGAAKGYRPHPLFDTGYYARQMARRLSGTAAA
jgi:hypothetical protein